MMTVKIYHNPRCTKSRQTLQLLKDRGIDPDIVEYLKTPPTTAELTDILAMLQLGPRQLMRKQEDAYKANGLDDQTLSDAQLIKSMCEHPILIERPIVVNGEKAALGRPPENVISIL